MEDLVTSVLQRVDSADDKGCHHVISRQALPPELGDSGVGEVHLLVLFARGLPPVDPSRRTYHECR